MLTLLLITAMLTTYAVVRFTGLETDTAPAPIAENATLRRR